MNEKKWKKLTRGREQASPAELMQFLAFACHKDLAPVDWAGLLRIMCVGGAIGGKPRPYDEILSELIDHYVVLAPARRAEVLALLEDVIVGNEKVEKPSVRPSVHPRKKHKR